MALDGAEVRGPWSALVMGLCLLTGCGDSSDADVCRGVGLRGEVAGKSVSTSSPGGRGSGVFGSTDWTVHASFPGALFWGEGKVPAAPSPTWQGTGYLLGLTPPAGEMLAGTLTVSIEPAGELPDLSQPVLLGELRSVGACGATPVPGSLTLCVTANIVKNPDQCQGNTASLSGTLGGETLELSSGSMRGLGLGSPADGRMVVLGDASLRAHVTTSTAVVLMPPSGPHANEILCAAASYSEDAAKEAWTLTDLSVAGSLPGSPTSGELELKECSP